jgi:hypothetical protein
VVHLHSSKAGVLENHVVLKPKPIVFYTPHGYAFLRTDISTMSKRDIGTSRNSFKNSSAESPLLVVTPSLKWQNI